MIVSQVLKPGSTVTEAELALQAGFGRTPIREALQRLAREGLVAIRPRAAIIIREMTPPRQAQLLEARAALQEHTVRLAATRATVDQRARMLQLAQAVTDAAQMGDGELYLHIARDIHYILCEAADNEFLQNFMGALYTLSRQFAFTQLGDVDIPHAAATHAGILRAVAGRNTEEAALASKRMMDLLYAVKQAGRPTKGKDDKHSKVASAVSMAVGTEIGLERVQTNGKPTRAGGSNLERPVRNRRPP